MITCIPPFGDGELKEDHERKKGGGGQEKDGMERAAWVPQKWEWEIILAKNVNFYPQFLNINLTLFLWPTLSILGTFLQNTTQIKDKNISEVTL